MGRKGERERRGKEEGKERGGGEGGKENGSSYDFYSLLACHAQWSHLNENT